MAKLPRKTQKIFCSKPTSENQTSVFGTMKTADKQYSTDVGTLQSNAAYEQGWKSATIASYKPFMEDFNTLNYINTSQLAYLFQQGIPEWDEATAYYKNSFCSYNGDLWQSLIDDNLGNAPFEGDEWTLFTTKNKGGGLELCDIGTALYVDETKGLRRYLNGQVVDINANTQAFLTRLKEITTLYPSLLCTEDEWQTAKTMSAFGQVGKFVFNYSGDEIVSVRIPRVVNVQGLFDLQNLGMTVSAGLPNITGKIGGNTVWSSYAPEGAFYYNGESTGVNGAGVNGGGGELKQYFDASRSSSVYGNSDTVQQEAIQYPYFIQIATGSETENNIVNDIELNNPFSLFDSKYSDHKLNNLSWLKSEGQWNAKAVYPTAYDELLREYNNPDRLATFNRDAFEVVGSPTITDDGVASGFKKGNDLKFPAITVTDNSTIVIRTKIKTVPKASSSDTQGQCIFGFYKNGTDDLSQFFDAYSLWNGINITLSYRVIEGESPRFISINTTPNTEYEYKVEITKNAIKCYLDGELKGQQLNLSFDMSLINNVIGSIGTGARKGLTPTRMKIYLPDFSITVDGQRVFSGAKSKVKLSTETYTDYDFVLNTAEETFRLPIKTKLASGKAVVGNGMTLGLTNGTLNASPLQAGDDYVYSQSYYGKNLPYNTGNTIPSASRLPLGSALGVTTDPTKSGIELSDNGLYLYFYVGETVQNANLIDAGRIGEQLVDKLDRSAVKAYIVETYVNGTSGYRIWSDGYCEQWGLSSAVGGGSSVMVSLLKSYVNVNYNITLASYGSYTAASEANDTVYALTTSSFKISSGYIASQQKMWKTCGYIK